ncbi:unnamed protein product [Vitrella brassicaformis CCMP3155]|uniref:Alpha-type protein kinase domain-containing protein n=2 Tax=Vitrella brassicaformis TaxID=1169539 RepID=A0A0G4GZH6_VITBC|nr:unnamed protein product [Vitrella brassicaformis CCMP3155]|eukprot:CEM36414.1 unnamed protein product [Vitrella brassicaformis CCMP3155]
MDPSASLELMDSSSSMASSYREDGSGTPSFGQEGHQHQYQHQYQHQQQLCLQQLELEQDDEEDTLTRQQSMEQATQEMRMRLEESAKRELALQTAQAQMRSVVSKVVDKANSVDLVTMMDCTGSMTPYMREAKRTLTHIIDELKDSNPNMRFRVGFVGYRDFEGGSKRLAIWPLTDDIASVTDFIARQKAFGGGGDGPEDVAGALKAVGDMQWQALTKAVIHVGDAPPHGLQYHDNTCPGHGDDYPGGDPNGLRIEQLMQGFRALGLDYCFVRITKHTGKMIEVMRAAYDDPATLRQVQVEHLGGDIAAFKRIVVRSVSKSISNSVKRMSQPTPVRRRSSIMGPNSGWLASIAEDKPSQPRKLRVDKSPPNWDALNGTEEDACRYTYHVVLDSKGTWKAPEITETKQDSRVQLQKAPFAEGAMRYAFYMKEHFLDLKRVAKLPIESHRGGEKLRKDVLADMETQAVSKALAKVFNEALLKKGIKRMIDFIDVSVYELPSRGESERWVAVEPFVEGRYEKYTNNNGWVSNETGSQLAQAFSHWSWEHTGGELMVVDIQGVNNIYTDPQIHSKDMTRYGHGNLGEEGMGKFFASHTCNEVCVRLGLDHPNPTAAERMMRTFKSAVASEWSCRRLANCAAPYSMYVRRQPSRCTLQQGRDVYCATCEKRMAQEVTKARCAKCGNQFTFSSFWYRCKGVKEPTTHTRCRAK